VTLFIDYRLTKPIPIHAVFQVSGFTALLGRSGAGKTSLLKALAGLLPAAGAPWAGLPPEERRIGYMPQGAALFPHLSVLENVAYPLHGGGRFAKAAALLEELGLAALGGRSAATLSGGEAQRVALARALARDPVLLLLDEPSAALDAATKEQVMVWLLDSIAARGIPALAATHDPAVAGMADRVALLAAGTIIQQGAVADVFNAPETAAAAGLLGYQNIWEGPDGWLAIRAEDIRLSEAGVQAVVTAVRAQGGDVRLTCWAETEFVVIVRSAVASDYAKGQAVFLDLPRQKIRRLRPV
jgi:ABC-type Fe3+/spermidine/putrescine transport system ATPase subunit